MKSRKFIAAIALFIASTAFVFSGHTEFSGWSDMMKWVFGIYAAGNVGAATVSRVKIGNGYNGTAGDEVPPPWKRVITGDEPR